MENKGHRYTVELRVWGAKLAPESISLDTGLQPCQVRRAGERRGNRTFSTNMWAFDGGGPRDWESLEDGLTFMLDKVEASANLFARYKKDHDVVWWCGHFQDRFDGGPELSASLLARLGAFGANLFIDNYFNVSEPAP